MTARAVLEAATAMTLSEGGARLDLAEADYAGQHHIATSRNGVRMRLARAWPGLPRRRVSARQWREYEDARAIYSDRVRGYVVSVVTETGKRP